MVVVTVGRMVMGVRRVVATLSMGMVVVVVVVVTGTVDVVVVAEILEHLQFPGRLVDEAARPGGKPRKAAAAVIEAAMREEV